MEKNEILGLILYIGFTLLLFTYVALSLTIGKNKPKLKKALDIIFPLTVIAGIILILIFMPTKSDEKDKYKPLSQSGMYIFSFLLIAVITLLTNLSDKKDFKSSTKELAFAGISIGLAFVLSYIKLFSLPQGGSVTLASMFPIILYSYVYGAKKGLFVGVIYGLLQFVQSPQVYEPMQVLLDYPVAFGALGLAGTVKYFNKIKKPLPKFITGALIAVTFRYISHFLSGYYVFSSWALEGYTALSWSIVYNLYIFAELAIVLVVGIPLFSSKSFSVQLEKLNPEITTGKEDGSNNDLNEKI